MEAEGRSAFKCPNLKWSSLFNILQLENKIGVVAKYKIGKCQATSTRIHSFTIRWGHLEIKYSFDRRSELTGDIHCKQTAIFLIKVDMGIVITPY